MKTALALLGMLLLVSCNDIDGTLKVFTDFVLIDEGGREVTLPSGTHSAEFSWKRKKAEVELEVDDIVGDDDRDFEFEVEEVADLDFRLSRIELEVSSEESGQPVDANLLVTNVMEQKAPVATTRRCHGSIRRPIIYVEGVRFIDVTVVLSADEDDLAVFEGSKTRTERKILWEGECGERIPEWEYTPGN